MKKIILAALILPVLSFSQDKQPKCWFETGGYAWEGALHLNDSVKLRFLFTIFETKGAGKIIYIYNGQERITVDQVTLKNDSLLFKMPVFDSEFKCKWQSKYKKTDSLSGVWINHARKTKNIIPFSARRFQYKTARMLIGSPFRGKWETTFSPGDKDNESKAVGIFTLPHCWDFIYGTFLTETGDYRYLCGTDSYEYHYSYLHDSLRQKGMSDLEWKYERKKIARTDTIMELSCFDGAHAFYFKAKIKADGTLEGDFYSGSHWHEKWIAKRNDSFELRNPDSLTCLKPGYDKINFSFKNLEGKTVSLSDDRYRGKVVIIYVMGSWCPNCMDETKYLAEFYKKYKSKGVEIVALAFEKDTSFAKAKAHCEKLKAKFDVQYEILLTQKTGKDQASAALPMLNAVMSFPTTIYIDKNGNVRKIYTGFTGPGTGIYYDKWAEENILFVEKLLKE